MFFFLFSNHANITQSIFLLINRPNSQSTSNLATCVILKLDKYVPNAWINFTQSKIHFTGVINRRALTKRSLIPSHVLVHTIEPTTAPAGINDRLHEDVHPSHNGDYL